MVNLLQIEASDIFMTDNNGRPSAGRFNHFPQSARSRLFIGGKMPRGVYIRTKVEKERCRKLLQQFGHRFKKGHQEFVSAESRKKAGLKLSGQGAWNLKGGISRTDREYINSYRRLYYKNNINLFKKHNYNRKVKTKDLTLKIIQEVYQENRKQYGILTCYLCLISIEFSQDCLEHKIPISRGGNNAKENLAIAHRSCNSRKNNKTEEEYRRELQNVAIIR
jgi:5-methylcytosine-specific restriction endonuclease McrA